MLNLLFPNPDVQKRITANSLSSLIQSYIDYLEANKFSLSTMRHKIRPAAHFGYWLDTQHIELLNVDVCILEQFFNHLPTCNCPHSRPGDHHHTAVGVRRFLAYLCQTGAISSSFSNCNDSNSHEILLDKFFQWTQLNRGISRQTGMSQRSHADTALHYLGDDPKNWEVKDIRQFVLSHFKLYKSSYIKVVGSNLRAFLRYLVIEGLCKPELINAVPKTAHWILSELPRYLSPDSIEQVITASSPLLRSALRDRAVILLLARLGLRAGDIINIRLTDIDWKQGLIRFVGKGRRETWLSLPQEPGDALLAYLEQERPLSTHHHVFLCSRAPFKPFKSAGTVQRIVRRALKKAAIEHPHGVLTHIFRHSLARRLLAQNIPLRCFSRELSPNV